MRPLILYLPYSGSLTSGEEPTLLGHGNTDWWYGFIPWYSYVAHLTASLRFDGDISTYHFFSVEKMFGVSRKIIAQVARVSSLLSRNAKYEAIPASLRLIEDPPPLEADPVLFSLHTGAKDLWFELKTGTVKTISTDLPRIVVVGEEDESSIVSELEEERELVKHPRLESGNNAYRRTLQVCLTLLLTRAMLYRRSVDYHFAGLVPCPSGGSSRSNVYSSYPRLVLG
jgi:hypothetical protein